MIEIPENVEEWTYGKIVDLVNEGYDENDVLEFKREINTESDRLCNTTCAFANTNGGTIIFGIDNDRQTPMHLHDRIRGIEDSDGLKRSIIDKINNIHPNIPIKNLIFRKSNIRLPNKKVIVILKITTSNVSPHQYNHIFYKRLVDGNNPMGVDEISRLILNNKKNELILNLIDVELGMLYDTFITTKKLFDDDENLVYGITHLQNFSYDALKFFLYNQSYLFEFEVSRILVKLIELVEKFETFNSYYETILLADPKHEDFDNQKTKIIKKLDECINHIDSLKRLLGLSILKPVNSLYKNYFEK